MTDKGLTAKEGPIWVFAAGLVPGLAVALMQFLLSWAEFNQISKFSAMKIKGVLNSRDGEEYYGKLLANAQTHIDVLGVTASRFASDFADETSTRIEKKVLIAALARGVRVRILLPEKCYLSQEDQSEKFPKASRIFGALRNKFNNIEIRYFDHKAIASIVRVDDDILVGPIFENVESRHTPALHTSTGSSLAQSYLSHFDAEWSSARSL